MLVCRVGIFRGMEKATVKPVPDWEKIEADYRAGILSLREIAEAHPGVNHVAIARRAKRYGATPGVTVTAREVA